MSQILLLSVFALLFSFSTGKCDKNYDFIVVGAGAGGGAMARRLAESGRFRVLLLEAGGMPKKYSEVPSMAPRFVTDPDVTFQYESTPQENVLSNDGVVYMVAGKMLGGTTSLNWMFFNRGSPHDWDNWANVTGDESWKYQNMMKYFKRVETYRGDYPSLANHGNLGPVTVSRPKYAPGLDYWLEAGKELGYSVGDPNGPQRVEFSPVEFAKRRGRRDSSWRAYLIPYMNLRRPNLKILVNSTVSNIIFEGTQAVGVKYISNDSTENVVYATKEIIICAGAYNSPLILQRSGIGPRDVLQAANITVIQELPVGYNYNDHPATNLNFAIDNASAVMDEKRDLTDNNWRIYQTSGYGPYSSTRGAFGQAFVASSVATAENNADWPDIHLQMSHCTLPSIHAAVMDTQALANLTKDELPISASVFLGRPKSRGTVSINATNPLGNPIVDLRYLTDPRDMQIFLDGISQILKIYEETNSYRKLHTRYIPITLPACEQFPMKSVEYWICYVKHTIAGGCHPAGTTKMGSIDDPTAVVDSKLRVIGVNRLRVVDASVMPFITNANPHAAVYAIAEKVAEMLLRKW